MALSELSGHDVRGWPASAAHAEIAVVPRGAWVTPAGTPTHAFKADSMEADHGVPNGPLTFVLHITHALVSAPHKSSSYIVHQLSSEIVPDFW
jgi:hypothetical protein